MRSPVATIERQMQSNMAAQCKSNVVVVVGQADVAAVYQMCCIGGTRCTYSILQTGLDSLAT